MTVEIKYGSKDCPYTFKGELISESNRPVYDEDGKTLLYNERTLRIRLKPPDDSVPVIKTS